jgi:chromate transporter
MRQLFGEGLPKNSAREYNSRGRIRPQPNNFAGFLEARFLEAGEPASRSGRESVQQKGAAVNSTAPQESYVRLFRRFLRFGLLAWGGPVAQLAMIRHELVEVEQWITPARFNRVMAVYQALPGPEAHEMCVYFGTVARGRWGGILAGLGFMLPGFVLMMAFSWFYVTFGIGSPLFAALFAGAQPAVAALIVRAVQRIGAGALRDDNWLWAIAVTAAAAQLLGVNFLLTLAAGGLVYAFAHRGQGRWAAALGMAFLALIAFTVYQAGVPGAAVVTAESTANAGTADVPPTLLQLLGVGLLTGLLTFGGAYTAIPFLQQFAVELGGWLTQAQFLDGIALAGILPAPLIIFGTFVGYLAGGPLGGIVMTVGIFAPAFAFTLIGHEFLEKLVDNEGTHALLDGITASVVGLVGGTALVILNLTVTSLEAWVIFAAALLVLARSKARLAVAYVVLGAMAFSLMRWLLFG